MSYEMIATLMFSTMLLMMITGQRVFGAIGFVAVVAAILLWGPGGSDMGFSSVMKLMKWNALLTLPMFVFMGYVMSESRLAEDLYKMFHVWFGPLPGGLAVGTILLMVMISAMNGLSVAGMAIGATIALPELVKRNYDKLMISGRASASSSRPRSSSCSTPRSPASRSANSGLRASCRGCLWPPSSSSTSWCGAG
jgi:TRAP-type mannitol/chloroaromatic compound transport system permease large subunit